MKIDLLEILVHGNKIQCVGLHFSDGWCQDGIVQDMWGTPMIQKP